MPGIYNRNYQLLFYFQEDNKPGNRNLDNDLSQYWQTRGFLHSFKNCKINVQTWKFFSFYAIWWLLATTKENKRNWSLGYIYEKYLFIWFKCILQNCGFQKFHVNVPLSTCLGFIIIKSALHYFLQYKTFIRVINNHKPSIHTWCKYNCFF